MALQPKSLVSEQKIMIPIKTWAANNNYSIDQVRTLIRNKLVLAKKHKHQWYVVEECELPEYV